MAAKDATVTLVAPPATNRIPNAAVTADPYWQAFWENITNADTATALYIGLVAVDFNMHVIGTFDSATVALEGSVDGTNFTAIVDGAGDAVALTAAGTVKLGPSQVMPYMRMTFSGGGGSQDIDIYWAVRPHIQNKV